ncbi:hypothetical protein NPX13_g9952 [Xylaria arbuscula]|uniref:C2H2-type domain-containing protein n=1 Tax=Xylaria arbuscula TaxID=114810 RepID=A0A9W8N5R7_9PEZI|nr:hypothetical protein NPX13_g9952 [Xylaria arbuscula]
MGDTPMDGDYDNIGYDYHIIDQTLYNDSNSAFNDNPNTFLPQGSLNLWLSNEPQPIHQTYDAGSPPHKSPITADESSVAGGSENNSDFHTGSTYGVPPLSSTSANEISVDGIGSPNHDYSFSPENELAVYGSGSSDYRQISYPPQTPASPTTPLTTQTTPPATGAQPPQHQCPDCPGSSFATAQELRRHRETTKKMHRKNVKPLYVCACGYSDDRRDNYKRHLNYHKKTCNMLSEKPSRCRCGETSVVLHTNVEVLVWKPPRLEVLASEIGVLHTTFAPQGRDAYLKLTLRHLGEIIN